MIKDFSDNTYKIINFYEERFKQASQPINFKLLKQIIMTNKKDLSKYSQNPVAVAALVRFMQNRFRNQKPLRTKNELIRYIYQDFYTMVDDNPYDDFRLSLALAGVVCKSTLEDFTDFFKNIDDLIILLVAFLNDEEWITSLQFDKVPKDLIRKITASTKRILSDAFIQNIPESSLLIKEILKTELRDEVVSFLEAELMKLEKTNS